MDECLLMLRDSLDAWGLGVLVSDYETRCPVSHCEAVVSPTAGALMGLTCQAGHNGAQMFAVVDQEDSSPDEIEAERIRSLLRDVALEGRESARMELDENISEADGLAPRYPSTLTYSSGEPIFFYGLQALIAGPGIGKSNLAISAAIDTASTGEWAVVYFNAELDVPELSLRMKRNVMSRTGKTDMSSLFWYSAGGKTTVEGIVEICSSHVTPGKKLLVVVDSINSLAEFASYASGKADLVELARLFSFCTQARKDTEGQVSFLVISELNANGDLKGRKGSYSADSVIKLEKTADDGLVNIKCVKGRSSGEKDFGNFINDWKRCRFTPAEEATDSPF